MPTSQDLSGLCTPAKRRLHELPVALGRGCGAGDGDRGNELAGFTLAEWKRECALASDQASQCFGNVLVEFGRGGNIHSLCDEFSPLAFQLAHVGDN